MIAMRVFMLMVAYALTSTLVACSSAYTALPKSSYVVDEFESQAVFDPAQKKLLLGVYVPDYLGTPGGVKKQLKQLDRWSGKRHSIAGIFVDLETPNPHFDIPAQAGLLLDNGYTPLFNLTFQRSLDELIAGKVNDEIYTLGAAFKNLIDEYPDNKLLVAPLPEMNGFWEAYGEDPKQFQMAYHQIRDLFFQAGVPRDAMYWIFSPNGWSREGHEFEKYYPGDPSTDAVAYSSYNFGFCSTTDWPKWQSAQALHEGYLLRMKNMTSKPIIIGQTASTAYTESGYLLDAKDQWLVENYAYLATAGNVMAVMYFNVNKECDWAVHTGGERGVPGYRKAIAHPDIQYVAPKYIHHYFD